MDAHLQLSADEMTALGHRVIDLLVERSVGIRDRPVSRVVSRSEAEARLRGPLAAEGMDPLELVDRLARDVLGEVTAVDHPRFFAFVPGPGHFVSAMGDALAAGANVFAGTWLGGSAAAQLELVVIDWIREACGMPPSSGGILLSGGSMANLTALATARDVHDARDGLVYFSDQTHSAVARALRVLGFRESSLRMLDSTADFTLDVDALAAAVRADRATGLQPFCVVANAGTTNTGAVDPLGTLADFCETNNLWLHVDGAYGAAAAFGARGRAMLAGLGRANSVALDPHKWLFQTFECGCLLVRDPAALRRAFAIHPEYLQDTVRASEEVNFCDYGVQLSRSARAIKLWLSLSTFGAGALGDAIDRAFTYAEHAEACLRQRSGWEIVSPARMGIVAFRFAATADPDRANLQLAESLRTTGKAMVSTTRLRGQTVLRMCPINPRTTVADIELTISLLDDLASSYR